MKITGGMNRAGASAILLLALGCSKATQIDGGALGPGALDSGVGGRPGEGTHQPDAGSGGRGAAGPDSGVSGSDGHPTGQSDAGVAQTRACSASTGVSCPYVNCDGAWAAFPETLHVSGRFGAGANSEPVERLEWRLSTKPATSALSDTGPDSSSFNFVPDVPGDYTWCLSGTTASYDLAERCCAFRSVTDFQSSCAADSGTQSIDDVEFASGRLLFHCEANQPFETTSVQASSSRESVHLHAGVVGEGAGWNAVQLSLMHNDGGTISNGGVQAGDTFAVQAVATPSIVGQATTISASILLSATTPPTNASAQVITAMRSNLYAGAGGTIGVRFAENPNPDAVWLKIGGWALAFGPTTSIAVADDGEAPDAVAGDGWFTGLLNEFIVAFIEPCSEEDGAVPDETDGGSCDNPNAGHIYGRQVSEPATYSVLMRPQSAAGVGPYYRANLEWK